MISADRRAAATRMPMRTSVAMTADVDEALCRYLLRGDGQEDLCLATYRVATGLRRRTALLGDVHLPPDPHTNRAGLRLLNVITGVEALADVTCEKGVPVNDRFDRNSVFAVIDKLAGSARQRREIREMSPYFDRLETLVCTDMGTEPCDFIAMQPDRIAFIHAKYGEGAIRSATVFHDVVAQAIKNLSFVLPGTQSSPPKGNWDQPWRSKDSRGGTVKRLRTPTVLSADEIWRRTREIVTDPAAQKEVWIVLGDGMSIASVRTQMESRHPADEIIQIYTLLQTAFSTVAQCGAQLRIFCSP